MGKADDEDGWALVDDGVAKHEDKILKAIKGRPLSRKHCLSHPSRGAATAEGKSGHEKERHRDAAYPGGNDPSAHDRTGRVERRERRRIEASAVFQDDSQTDATAPKTPAPMLDNALTV